MGSKDKSEVVDLERLVLSLRRLKAEAETRRQQFFDALLHAETNFRDVWSTCGTFEAFLTAYDLISPSLYTKWRAAKSDPVVAKKIASIGADASCEAMRVSPEARPTFVKACEAHVERLGQVPTSRHARNIAAQVDPKPVVPKAMAARETRERLEAEVSRLKAENKALRAEVARLEKELRKHKPDAA